MLDALEYAKPVLPRRPCPIHDPERIEHRAIRRASVPCPQCWAENPKNKTPKTFVKLLQRPIAETGKNGYGLKVTIENTARIVYEVCSNPGKPALVWRIREAAKP